MHGLRFRSAHLAGAAAVWIVAVSAAGACRPGAGADGRIPDSTLVSVLADLHIAEARGELFGPPQAGWRDSVLARHGLDSADVNRTLRYYSRRPGAYTELYSDVLDRINEIWNTRLPAPMSLPDSLAAAEDAGR